MKITCLSTLTALFLLSARVPPIATAGTPDFQDAEADSPSGTWKMTYRAGAAPLPPGARVAVAIAGGEVTLKAGKGEPFRIPARGITAVLSNFSSSHHASSAQAEFWTETLVNRDPFVMLLPFGLAAAALSYPIKSHESYVRIAWTENNTDQDIVLSLARNDYTPFLTGLQAATGKPWKNVQAEWQQLKNALAREAANSITVHVEQSTRVGKAILKPGAYQLVVLDREPGQGDAYFFRGSPANLDDFAAAAHVGISADEGQTDVRLDYGPAVNGAAQLIAIRLTTKTLQLLQ